MDEINRLVEVYTNVNPDQPLWEQYVNYMSNLLMGDLGRSIVFDEPVSAILADALPWTIFIMSIALILTYLFGILLGAFMAFVEGSRTDSLLSSISTFLASIPYYVAALVMLAVLGFNWGLFPTGGRIASGVEPPSLAFFTSALYHATLPILSLVITGVGGIALTMRANSIQVIGSDYMRVADLRGLVESRVVSRYVVPNAVLPMYTSMMIAIGFMFGGSVILERIFTYPGIGFYLIEAIDRRDYTLLMGGFIVITIAVVIGVYIADLTYGKIDPRAQSGGNDETYGVSSSLTGFLSGMLSSKGGASQDDEMMQSLPEQEVGQVPFELSEVESESTSERRRRLIDTWVIVPLKILWSDWRGKVGILIVSLYILMGTVGVRVMAPPQVGEYERMAPPFQSLEYPLGTDIMGQDLLAMTVHATPPMLKMILAGSLFATIIATIVGLVSGYVGGKIDRGLMTFTDIAMTIPGLPLIIVLAAIIEPRSPYLIGILLTINAWAGLARTIRSQVLPLREESYVETSRIMGISVPSILTYDVSPNIMPYVLINFTNSARTVIFNSVGLYFLGVFPFTSANWGVMMNTAQQNNALVSWGRLHWIMVPMVTVVLLSYGLILISQSSDQIFNPKLRAKRKEQTIEEEEGAPVTTPAD